MGSLVIVVSWSEIDTARQCMFKHDLQYKERWQQPPRPDGALSKGILWHELMDVHYGWLRDYRAAGGIPQSDDKIRAYVQENGLIGWVTQHPVGKAIWEAGVRDLLYSPLDGSQTPVQELMAWMYEGHLGMWGLDQQWEIVAVEHAVEYPLYKPDGRKSRFRLKTKIDLIVREKFRGIPRLMLIDHKSGKDLPKGKDFGLMDQFALYEGALRRVGQRPFATIHSAARTHRNVDQVRNPQPLETRFLRTPMARTEGELEVIAQEALMTVVTAYGYKSGLAPRSPNPDTCGWKCDFTEACLAGRRGMDVPEMLSRMGFQVNKTRH